MYFGGRDMSSLFVVVVFGCFVSCSSLATDSKCKKSGVVSSGPGDCTTGEVFLKGQYIEVGIHNVGSFGTESTAPSGSVYSGKRLGFIADYDKNGFYSSSPGYAGDYFVPGAPVEGWLLQWTSSSGGVNKYMMEGLMGNKDIYPTSFEVTSTDHVQSAQWVGRRGEIEISKVTQFKNTDVYFTTSVTLKNIGSSTVTDLYYMRTVDPDQEQPYYGYYTTMNYVKYQPLAEDGSDCCLSRSYVSPTNPNSALVAAMGYTNNQFFCGLGTINPSARVSHYGFYENSPSYAYGDASGTQTWTYYGGNDMQPESAYRSRMRQADEAIHLVFKYPTLAPGETAQFTYAYVLKSSDLEAAMAGIAALVITQPTSEMSGTAVTIAAQVSNVTATEVSFSVYGVKPSVSSTATWYSVGTVTGSLTTYSILFDSTEFLDGNVQILASATIADGAIYTAYKASEVANAGVIMVYTISDDGGTYPFSSSVPTVLNMTESDPSLGAPDSVSFYREIYSGGAVVSTLLETDTSAPWSVSVSVSDLAVGTVVAVKASVSSGSGAYETSTVFSGIVAFDNSAPTDITLSATTVSENSANGKVVATLSSTDVDSDQSHTYTLVDSAGGRFDIAGTALIVGASIDYESTQTLSIRLRTNDGESKDCCFEKDFTITVTDVNESPTAVSPAVISTPENVVTGTTLATLSTSDPDPSDTHTYSLISSTSLFSLTSTGALKVTGSIDYEAVQSVSLFVRSTDSGSPNMNLDSVITVTIEDVNEAPTAMTTDCNPCVVVENTAVGSTVATLTTTDVDAGDSHTYTSVDENPSSELFAVSTGGVISIQNEINYEETGDSVVFRVRTTDSGGLTFTRSFTIVITNVAEPPSSGAVECFCDEDRGVGDIASSSTMTSPAFCQVPASTADNSELAYAIISDQGSNGNYNGAFDIQSCSGVILVNGTLDYESFSLYNFTVQVQSNGGLSYSQVVIYLVNVNEYPSMESRTFSVDENSNQGLVVIENLTMYTTDPDEADPSSSFTFCCEKVYQIESGNSAGMFSLSDPSAGTIIVANSGLNFESVNSYTLIISVTDKGGLMSSAAYVINLNDVNENPSLVESSGTFSSIDENSVNGSRTGIGIYATDVDIGQSVSLDITGGNTDNVFTLESEYSASTGLTSYYFTVLNASINYERLAQYNLEVTATDNGSPPLTDSGLFVVKVTDVNEPPVITASMSFSMDENSPQNTNLGTMLRAEYSDPDEGSTAIFSISNYGSDGAKTFGINSTSGQLYLAQTYLNFEATPSFTYTVKVTDNGGLFASSTVLISVNDVPEAPVFDTYLTGEVSENLVAGAYVVNAGQALEYSATDDDDDALNFTVISVDGDVSSASMFQVVPESRTSMSLYTEEQFDYEIKNSYSVLLQVTDGVFNRTTYVTIDVADENDAPVVDSSIDCYVAENAASGTEICSIIASDVDTYGVWGNLNYSLVEPVSGLAVSYVNDIGTLYLTSNANTSWLPGDVIHSILVRVVDGGGLYDIANVSLTITDVNFPPKCPTTPFSFAVLENTVEGEEIATLSGSDQATTITDDSGTGLICTITSGNSAGKFAIAPGCVLTTTASALNYESVISYSLSVQAKEDSVAPQSVTCPVQITVTDVNEPTILNNQTFTADENIVSGRLISNNVYVNPVVVIDEDPADQNGLFSLICVVCGSDPIAINSTTGILSLKSGFSLNFEVQSQYIYDVSWSSRSVFKSATVTINIANKNEAPVASPSSITVAENVVSSEIGYIQVTDPDFEDVVNFDNGEVCQDFCGLRYTVDSTTSGSLSVDANTGAIRISSTGIDFENAASHTLNVKVKDSTGLTSTCIVTIYISDIPDCTVTSIADISGAVVNSAPTSGGMQLFITGRNFGPTTARMQSSGMTVSDTTVTGSLQSSASSSLATYMFAMACDVHRTDVHENTQVNCTLPAGISTNLGVVLTITTDYGGAAGIKSCTTPFSTATLAYAPPQLSNLTNAHNLSTSGGAVVAIEGSNFGNAGDTYNIVEGEQSNSYISEDVSCTVVAAHVSVECISSDGYGSSLDWKLIVGGQDSNILSGESSYARPHIMSVIAEDMDTMGGDSINITGTNFGDEITVLKVTYGAETGLEYTASCTLERAHAELSCFSAPGIGRDLKFIVTVADQSSMTFSSFVKYKPPQLDGISGAGASSASTEGGDIFYLSGSEFGPVSVDEDDIVVTYGKTGVEFTAVECEVITASTKLKCLTAPGTGTNLKFIASIGGQSSPLLSTNSSYDPPTVASFSGSGSVDALTSGNQTVLVYGSNFGPTFDNVDMVFYTEFNGTVFVATENCSMYTPHKTLYCRTLPGAGSRLVWSVVVDGQLSVSPTTSYGAPKIMSLAGSGVVNASVDGGDLVILTGQNFGPPNAVALYGKEFLEQVTYGPSGTEYTAAECEVLSNSEIQCYTVAGVGGSLYWQVTVAGQSSGLSDQTSSYARPKITSIDPNTASTDGTQTISVFGENFAVDTTPKVYFATKRVNVFANGEDELVFFSPVATTVSQERYGIYVDVGGQLSNVVYFSYMPPKVNTLNTVDSGNNSVILSIGGSSFSLKPVVTIYPVDSPTPVVPYCYYKSHAQIICDISVRGGNVTVSTNVATSNMMYYEFGEPLVLKSSFKYGTAMTSGYTLSNPVQIYIVGQNFGSEGEFIVNVENSDSETEAECDVTVYNGVSKTESPSEWSAMAATLAGTGYDPDVDFQEVYCKLPAGQGSYNSLRVVKGLSYSLGCGCELCTTASCLSYLPPTISSIVPSTGITNGGYKVALLGSNFGLSRTVTIGGVPWPVNVNASNHTYVELLSVANEGSQKLAVVQVGNQDNSGSTEKYFSYLAPSIDEYISTLEVGTAGSASPINVTGDNFGIQGPTVMLGDVKIDVKSFTHNRLTFYIPPGQGKDLMLTVNVSNQIGESPDMFAYIPPSISNVWPLNCDTSGGRDSNVIVVLRGRNFGYVDLDWELKIGEYSVPMEDIVFFNGTEIQFYPPAGQGQNLTVALTVGGQIHTGGPYLFSYNPPKILSMEFPDDINTKGGYTMTFNGMSFGTSGLTVYIQDPLYDSSVSSFGVDSVMANNFERMGPTLCPVVSQTHTVAKCTVPKGAGKDLVISFSVDGQVTYSNFSYSNPVINFFYQSNGGDAIGDETLKLYGENFGAFRTPLNISIGGVPCLDSVWLADDAVYNYDPYLKCTTPSTIVGTLNVTVHVAYQASLPNDRYTVTCKKGAFGGPGEYCTDCGESEVTGYVCDQDNMYSPTAHHGWYLSFLQSPSGQCPEATSSRETCPAVLPCMPSSACEGNNTCSEEYTGDRCAECNEGYYRINGKCQECPTAPWAIVLAGILVLICGGYIAYKLQAKNVNLGILSIGIDYFQVLAVFGTADVSWPPSLVNMYNSFSIFNLNIDVAAPDCWNAVSVSFKKKWIGITVSPLIALLIIAIVFLCYYAYMRIFRSAKGNQTEMLYKCIAVYLMLFYYGYLMLSNNTLAIFNCQPTDPPDGYKYMAEIGPDGGRCYREGTIQQELEPWAIIAFIVYTIGFPAFVAFVLHTNSDKCVYAQVMKAAGKVEGGDFEKQKLTRFKAIYNRLFYQFKPEYYYWIFCILIRKFCLSVAAVVFRENTVFLLALYLLVLFTSYTAQVNYKPYMSTSEYADIAEKYADVISMHTRESTSQKRGTKINVNRLGNIGPMFELKAPELDFFNNYNTVESYLLFSAIMVAISAIMFESDELTGTQRDSLAYLVIFIVAVSLGYFFWVLFTELWVAFFPTVPLFCIKPKEIKEEIDTDIEFADVSFERQQKNTGSDSSVEVVRLQTQLESAENMIGQMQSEISKLKKQRKSDTIGQTMPKSTVARKAKAKKSMTDAASLLDDAGL